MSIVLGVILKFSWNPSDGEILNGMSTSPSKRKKKKKTSEMETLSLYINVSLGAKLLTVSSLSKIADPENPPSIEEPVIEGAKGLWPSISLSISLLKYSFL